MKYTNSIKLLIQHVHFKILMGMFLFLILFVSILFSIDANAILISGVLFAYAFFMTHPILVLKQVYQRLCLLEQANIDLSFYKFSIPFKLVLKENPNGLPELIDVNIYENSISIFLNHEIRKQNLITLYIDTKCISPSTHIKEFLFENGFKNEDVLKPKFIQLWNINFN